MASGLPTPKGYDSDWREPRKTQWEPVSKTYKYIEPTKTLESFFNDMFFLGFHDQIARWNSLTTMTKPQSFPPYNLVKINDDTYKVEMAVAGYSKDDVDITVERDQLIVASKDLADSESEVIYQGIAQRQWRQKFILGEYMEVKDAVLKDGLLTINIVRNLPAEAKPKVIKIK